MDPAVVVVRGKTEVSRRSIPKAVMGRGGLQFLSLATCYLVQGDSYRRKPILYSDCHQSTVRLNPFVPDRAQWSLSAHEVT
jgi:hypothetical protein